MIVLNFTNFFFMNWCYVIKNTSQMCQNFHLKIFFCKNYAHFCSSRKKFAVKGTKVQQTLQKKWLPCTTLTFLISPEDRTILINHFGWSYSGSQTAKPLYHWVVIEDILFYALGWKRETVHCSQGNENHSSGTIR